MGPGPVQGEPLGGAVMCVTEAAHQGTVDGCPAPAALQTRRAPKPRAGPPCNLEHMQGSAVFQFKFFHCLFFLDLVMPR